MKCLASVLTRNAVHSGHEEEITLCRGAQCILLMAKCAGNTHTQCVAPANNGLVRACSLLIID